MKKQELAAMIDHTLLKPDATFSQVEETILYAKEIGAASVCINPSYVALAASLLSESDTKVCTVIGFPLGANSTFTKAKEAQNAYQHGADEIDMVINIGALKSGDYEYVENDIAAVVEATPALVKVILENCYLTKEEIVIACELAQKAGADFVKTSTGFGTGNATVADVKLMRESVSDDMGVKASGGIGSLKDAENMIKAGATRLGTSRTAAILAEFDKPVSKKASNTKTGTAKTASKKTVKKDSTAKNSSTKSTSKTKAPSKKATSTTKESEK